MRPVRLLFAFVVTGMLVALILTWATSATLTTRSGACTVVEHKPSWSLSYSVERTCP